MINCLYSAIRSCNRKCMICKNSLLDGNMQTSFHIFDNGLYIGKRPLDPGQPFFASKSL